MANAKFDVNATEIKGAVGENFNESESGEASTADSSRSNGVVPTLPLKTVPCENKGAVGSKDANSPSDVPGTVPEWTM
jgi:hypothetical protein